MNPTAPKTIVIFRWEPHFKSKDGGAPIAVFPCEPGNSNPNTCACYRHLGQHGYGDVAYFGRLRLATEEEYAPLKRELETYLGAESYVLDVRKRSHPAYRKQRIEAINR